MREEGGKEGGRRGDREGEAGEEERCMGGVEADNRREDSRKREGRDKLSLLCIHTNSSLPSIEPTRREQQVPVGQLCACRRRSVRAQPACDHRKAPGRSDGLVCTQWTESGLYFSWVSLVAKEGGREGGREKGRDGR